MILMASFVVIPLTLRDLAGIGTDHHWQIYLPVLAISALIMMPFLVLGERYNKTGLFFRGAVFLMILVQFSLYIWHMSATLIVILLTLFFLAFNYLGVPFSCIARTSLYPGQQHCNDRPGASP